MRALRLAVISLLVSGVAAAQAPAPSPAAFQAMRKEILRLRKEVRQVRSEAVTGKTELQQAKARAEGLRAQNERTEKSLRNWQAVGASAVVLFLLAAALLALSGGRGRVRPVATERMREEHRQLRAAIERLEAQLDASPTETDRSQGAVS